MEKAYWRYWGKARRGSDCGAPYHLLGYHCLDVAAVGAVYLERHGGLRSVWAARLGVAEERLTSWIVFFLALHDLGKFSYRFQGLHPDLPRLLNNVQPTGDYTIRHDTLGQIVFETKIRPLIIEHQWLGECTTEDRDYWRAIAELWSKCVTGHHGQPPKALSRPALILTDHFSPTDQQAALNFAEECAALFLPVYSGLLPDGDAVYQALTPLSWWLAGFSVLCDWVGSNEAFFSYRTQAMPLRDYWNGYALPQAGVALRAINLLPHTSRPQTLTTLFPYLCPPAQPTPLQQAAASLVLSPEPHLFILEDVTGAGKTEAALMLAQRLIAQGQADGCYFGLPTMATSNAMFRRVRDNDLPGKFFEESSNLILAHGASRLEPVFAALFGQGSAADATYAGIEASATDDRESWFADSRKKALLADIGVGTVDQALLAVLYSRHQSLRLLGLARKVLIVDEVHACDDYMLTLLKVLLSFQAAAGGSAILLSATLPMSTRQTLLDAYAKGLGFKIGASSVRETAYPLLTCRTPRQITEQPLATRPEVARSVRIKIVHAIEEVVAALLAVNEQGQCACWIRNTVDDAIAARELLRQAGVSDTDVFLFHARFAMIDRLAIESRVLESFGPASDAECRRGKILVATQVVEQSLDLDFDVMISDLAPIDLLIQRAGRLGRHRRDALGNRADTEGRGLPTLWLHTPTFSETPPVNWLGETFAATGAVYPDHGRLWLTTQVLREAGALVMPDNARTLVEGVYGADSDAAIPEVFSARTNRVEGDRAARRGMGAANTIKLEQAYEYTGFEPWDDARIPTRLEEQPSVTVRLARLVDGDLQPWCGTNDRHAWELSQLNVRYSLFAEEAHNPELAAKTDACRAVMPDKGSWSKLLVLTKADGAWLGTALNGKREEIKLSYDSVLGLRKT